jgi:hypothetical protein
VAPKRDALIAAALVFGAFLSARIPLYASFAANSTKSLATTSNPASVSAVGGVGFLSGPPSCGRGT